MLKIVLLLCVVALPFLAAADLDEKKDASELEERLETKDLDEVRDAGMDEGAEERAKASVWQGGYRSRVPWGR